MTQPSYDNLPTHGAVDLSALAPAPERRPNTGAPAGGAPGTADVGEPGAPADGAGEVLDGPYSLALSEANLEAVLQTSTTLPVVVVVTSARAEGSEQLAAEFAQFAAEAGGRFQVATVDAEAEPNIVAAFGVQALPSTLVVLAGQPVPVFQGTAAREQVRDVVNQILAAAAQAGLTGRVSGDGEPPEPAPEPVDPHMEAGAEALERGDLEAAAAAFEKAGIENPRADEPRAALAQVRLMQRVAENDPAAALAAAEGAQDDDLAAQLAAADAELVSGRPREALERVLRTVTVTFGDERETARQRLVDLFDVVGSHEPMVADVRRRLATVLY